MARVKLADIATIITGNTPKTSDNQNYASNDICFVKPSDIDDNELTDVHYTEYYISEYARNKARILPPQSILVTCIGIVGKVGINAFECAFNQQINAVIPDREKCDCRYLAYALQYAKPKLQSIANAPVVPILNKSQFSNIDIFLPSLAEQRKIAAVLDKVSDLIAKRRQQLTKLDELVKARFVEMFGDEHQFDKWHCTSVGEIADICVGVVIKPTQYYTDNCGIPAFRSLNIGTMAVKNSDWVYFTKEGHEKNKKSVIKENDVLVVRSGAPGTACVATKEFEGYNAIDIIIAHPNFEKINPIFLAMFTNMAHGMNQIRGKTGGAAQQHFNVSGYKSLTVILPPIELQNQFAFFVEQTEKTKTTISHSLEKLEILKNALMQEYFG